ncbi:MAG TPA: hypothetical protein ENN81_06845 [Phycisphaerales bacterium]|nr:hypothetical protein [Phycisphaerales bacterium]
MARNRGKKALYEVIGKSKMQPAGAKVEPLHPEPEPAKAEVEPSPPQPAEQAPEPTVNVETEPTVEHEPEDQLVKTEIEAAAGHGGVRWRKRPRAVQVHAGRIEFSVPYQAAVAVVLVLVLAVVGSYRLGQRSGVSRPPDAAGDSRRTGGAAGVAGVQDTPTGAVGPQPVRPMEPVTAAGPTVSDVAGSATTAAVASTGSNRIVIQTFPRKEDLVPVQQYFASKGIATEIRKIRDRYYLVTTNKYDNPGKPGSDGYAARARIIEIGAGYKAPEGFESFAPRLFSDAYGMKLDD